MYPKWILDNKHNYEYILKHNREYSTIPSLWTRSFVCSSAINDEGLKYLKNYYKLDRLKQGRSDLDICLRAMDWTFQNLLSKTQDDYSGVLNASDILKYCENSRTTVNCLCHATVLTEVLLALGFTARKVSCLPIDVVPVDNHVVTNVYVPSLGKWIMLDPSMCCYITDCDQNILSISEIRDYLIQSKGIYLHTYCRFSNLKVGFGKSYTLNPSDYITYLLKNLFRFLTRSTQDSKATKDNDIFYMLVPKDYLLSNNIQYSFIENANVELRITDNESFFWNI